VAIADDNLALDPELPLRRALSFWGGNVVEALSSLGLHALDQVPVRLLSAGQAKRASLARVAASGAPLWLLDEPANGLDSPSVDLLGGLIAKHRSGGGAVVAASHVPLPGEWRPLELGR
jgi:heme exporter protein A